METVVDLVSAEQGAGCSMPARSDSPQADGDLARVRCVAETYRSARCLYAQGARLLTRKPCLRLVFLWSAVARCSQYVLVLLLALLLPLAHRHGVLAWQPGYCLTKIWLPTYASACCETTLRITLRCFSFTSTHRHAYRHVRRPGGHAAASAGRGVEKAGCADGSFPGAALLPGQGLAGMGGAAPAELRCRHGRRLWHGCAGAARLRIMGSGPQPWTLM